MAPSSPLLQTDARIQACPCLAPGNSLLVASQQQRAEPKTVSLGRCGFIQALSLPGPRAPRTLTIPCRHPSYKFRLCPPLRIPFQAPPPPEIELILQSYNPWSLLPCSLIQSPSSLGLPGNTYKSAATPRQHLPCARTVARALLLSRLPRVSCLSPGVPEETEQGRSVTCRPSQS